MTRPLSFQIPATEHPFAPYVRILGKGKTGSRSLSREEAASAFAMILRGEVEALQLGAFLMLLRVKEETGEELAGFVDACRSEMLQPPAGLAADLDWSSYAGKNHHHPWYLLSLLLLSGAGYRTLVHGSDGHTAGRLYTEQAMQQLGLPVAANWLEAQQQLDRDNLSYLPLRAFCQPLHELVQLRPLLGLRSPVNTLTRMLNPLGAAASIQSIFHPAYGSLHQDADRLLDQPCSLVFKGESGEVEIKPHADTRLQLLQAGESREILLPRSIQGRVADVEQLSVEPLRALWRAEQDDDYGRDAVIATTASALYCLEAGSSGNTIDHCLERARALWDSRDRTRLD
ncbi:glycosyl transferase family protein [Haliea sp. E17]|uniref:glycosyl transferase family protein n=1 Tax=Haliea sp. E17 TaxID=3401576 RepID=UPI003AAEE6DD